MATPATATNNTTAPAPGAPAATTPAAPAPGAPAATTTAPATGAAGKPGTTQGQPAAGDPASGAPAGGTPASTAPEVYADFTLPQGVTLEANVLNEFKTFAKANGLSQAQAQAIVDNRLQQIQAGEAAAEAQWTQQLSAWETEFKADKEFGGANYEKSVQTAMVGINKFGGTALTKLLQDSGFIKHPDVLRTFTRIGNLLREDAPGLTTTSTGGNEKGQSVEQRAVAALYK